MLIGGRRDRDAAVLATASAHELGQVTRRRGRHRAEGRRGDDRSRRRLQRRSGGVGVTLSHLQTAASTSTALPTPLEGAAATRRSVSPIPGAWVIRCTAYVRRQRHVAGEGACVWP